jgi:hypothetical protein
MNEHEGQHEGLDTAAMRERFLSLADTHWGFIMMGHGVLKDGPFNERFKALLRAFSRYVKQAPVTVAFPAKITGFIGAPAGEAGRPGLGVFFVRDQLPRAVVLAKLREHFGFTDLPDECPSVVFCLTEPRWHCEGLDLVDVTRN